MSNFTRMAQFHLWLRAQGAEVLAPTNPYEFARFRARGGVHVIYERQNGQITANGFAGEAWSAFNKKSRLWMGITTKPRTPGAQFKAALVERDGMGCFFCGEEMTPEEMTVEHLVAKAKGGPDHMDNMVLSHETCNQKADNLPLIEKIKIHEQREKQ